MKRLLLMAALGLSSAVAAQGARIAIHPLDARELTVEQREWLKALFDVRLARTPGVRLAGSGRVEAALQSPQGKECETSDACLRYLAESSGSLYAIYARLRRDPVGGELLMTARVVRADGALVKTVSRRAHPEPNVELTETCRTLVTNVVSGLDLQSLPPALPAKRDPPQSLAMFSAPPLLAIDAPPQAGSASPRKRAGLALGTFGVASLTAGGLLVAMATDGRSRLTPNSSGAVPHPQAAAAANVAMQTNAAAVLIPVGALIGAAGALLAFWPEDPRVSIAVSGSPGGAGVLIAARLP